MVADGAFARSGGGRVPAPTPRSSVVLAGPKASRGGMSGAARLCGALRCAERRWLLSAKLLRGVRESA